MSSYKVVLKPGGVGGRNVGVGVRLQKKVASASGSASGTGGGGGGTPGLSLLSVYVAIISNSANLVADVNVSDGAGFSQAITDAGNHVFADVQPGTYTVTANNIVDGGGNTLVAYVFSSPAILAPDEHACIFVVYAAEPGTGPGLILKIVSDGGIDFGGDVFTGNIVLVIRNAANEVVVTTAGNNFPASGFGPAGTYTASVFSNSTGGTYIITGGGSQTGAAGDTLTFNFHGGLA